MLSFQGLGDAYSSVCSSCIMKFSYNEMVDVLVGRPSNHERPPPRSLEGGICWECWISCYHVWSDMQGYHAFCGRDRHHYHHHHHPRHHVKPQIVISLSCTIISTLNSAISNLAAEVLSGLVGEWRSFTAGGDTCQRSPGQEFCRTGEGSDDDSEESGRKVGGEKCAYGILAALFFSKGK